MHNRLTFNAARVDRMGTLRRRPFTLIPEKQELTTVEAANFLTVSRPFVIKEIDAGRTPHRMVGSHRRILLTDLMEYAKQMQASREAALDELSQLRAKANDQRQAQTTNKSGPESEPRALGE
jgi:excisionase family DNA binding protein